MRVTGPVPLAGWFVLSFFAALGDDEAMARFSKRFRAEYAHEGRSDESYAEFWRVFAARAMPISYMSRGDRKLSVTAYVTHHNGREEEADLRFEFDAEPPYGLRAIYVSTTR